VKVVKTLHWIEVTEEERRALVGATGKLSTAEYPALTSLYYALTEVDQTEDDD
jgi:hypothetical protein